MDENKKPQEQEELQELEQLVKVEEEEKKEYAQHPNKSKAEISFIILILAWVLAFSDTLKELPTYYWRSAYNIHGLLVIPFGLIITMLQKKEFIYTNITTSQFGLAVLFILNVLWGYFNIHDITLGQQLCVIGMFPAILLMMLGFHGIRVILLPIIFTLFAIPFGYEVAIRIPGLFENWLLNYWFIGDLSFNIINKLFVVNREAVEIRDALGILMYTPVLLMLSLFASYFISKNQIIQITTACLAIAAAFFTVFIFFGIYLSFSPIFSNIVSIKYISFFINIMTIFSIAITLLLSYFFSGLLVPQQDNKSEKEIHSDFLELHWVFPMIISYCAFFIIPWSTNVYKDIVGIKESREIHFVPPVMSGYEGPLKVYESEWNPDFPGSKHKFTVGYDKGSLTIQFFAAYFGRDAEPNSLINKNNRFYVEEAWNVKERNNLTINTPIFKELEIREIVLKQSGQVKVIWYFFYAGGKAETSLYTLNLLESLSYVNKTFANAGVIAVSVNYEGDIEYARENLTNFVIDLTDYLPKIMNPKKGKKELGIY